MLSYLCNTSTHIRGVGNIMNGALFWNASTEELKKGYTYNKQECHYACLLCGETFESGVIYPMNGVHYDAEKAASTHVITQHPPIFDFLLAMGRVYTGLSAGQEELAKLFSAGHSDKEIVALTGANSPSTVRNQRFAIREKYKQAKVLVALVELMEELAARQKKSAKQDESKLINFHPAATNIDERYAITQAERDEVLNRYFGIDGNLLIKGFPAKEKRKIIIMQKLISNFESNKQYTEKEVNDVLKRYYDDFVSVRRYMIQYGFLDRDEDGTLYRVKLM